MSRAIDLCHLQIQLTNACSSSLLLSVESPAAADTPGATTGVAGGEQVKKKKHRDSISVHKHREEKQQQQQQLEQQQQQQQQQHVAAIEAADEGPI